MTTITPISQSRHSALRWRRCDSYAFAAKHAVVPLIAAELAKAVLAFPVALIRKNEAFVPVAVLGLEAGRNLFVAEDGRWLGAYVPAALRGYPFVLGRTEEGKQLLCVDEGSGLVGGAEGERFFEDDGTPSKVVRQIMDFLTQMERNRDATAAACAALQSCNLIEPWPLAVKTGQDERKIDGLFRINEATLNALDDEAFLGVRRSGGLPVAYAQLLSMQQVRVLDLASTRARRAQEALVAPDLDLSWLDSDILKLGGKPH
jgi:hypothetical protein